MSEHEPKSRHEHDPQSAERHTADSAEHHKAEAPEPAHEPAVEKSRSSDGSSSESSHRSSSSHELSRQIESLQRAAEAKATPKEKELDQLHRTEDSESSPSPALINQELKSIAYQRTLRRVQKDLSAPERVFSKIIHQPYVETVSEVAGKTIARPSGILAGGVFAFVGSSLFLYVTKHYGYTYNFLMFIIFFAGGFGLGILFEVLVRLVRSAKN